LPEQPLPAKDAVAAGDEKTGPEAKESLSCQFGSGRAEQEFCRYAFGRKRMTVSKLKTFGVAAIAAVALAGVAQAQPKSLTLGTASVGGTYFIYGGVVATLVTEKTGINVSTQQTQGPNQNLLLVDSKAIELGMVTMGVALHGYNGTGWAKGKKYNNVRALFPMYDTPFHFITTDKTGITSVKQMDGKNVGVGPKAGTPGTYFPLMFEALGIKPTIRNGGASDMASQLGDGLLDVFAFA